MNASDRQDLGDRLCGVAAWIIHVESQDDFIETANVVPVSRMLLTADAAPFRLTQAFQAKNLCQRHSI